MPGPFFSNSEKSFPGPLSFPRRNLPSLEAMCTRIIGRKQSGITMTGRRNSQIMRRWQRSNWTAPGFMIEPGMKPMPSCYSRILWLASLRIRKRRWFRIGSLSSTGSAGSYDKAEENFQKLYQNTNFPPSELTYRARYKAGAVALQRYAYDNAIEYFKGLLNDTTCPPSVAADTYFALGDATTLRPPGGKTNGFEDAINAFSAIPRLFPTNRLVPIALGRIGDCHLQLGASDPTRYDLALTNYQEVLKPKWRNVPVSVRSQAEIGWGIVLEKQAELRPAQKAQLLREALDHYFKVFSQTNLQEGEQAEEFWVNKAGNEVARLASSLQQWSQAINVLNYLMNRFDRFPVLRADFAKKIEKAKERMLKE